MRTGKTIVGLGELLWDLLPSGDRLGGAPANFAVMAARLGNRSIIASRLGADARGERARAVLGDLPAEVGWIQTDPAQPTGTVGVELASGEPRYVIHVPAAWDFMECTREWCDLAAEADAVCFGTLAQRERESRETVKRFLRATRPACVRVFDVNLRAPFVSARVIAESLPLATIFKLNEAEVSLVMELLGGVAKTAVARSENELVSAAQWLLGRYPMQVIAITRGAAGSLLVTRDAVDRHPGVPVKIVDTVGAGDAFTAGLVDAFLRGAMLEEMNEAGNRWGAWVASQPGAMPDMDAALKEKIASHLQHL